MVERAWFSGKSRRLYGYPILYHGAFEVPAVYRLDFHFHSHFFAEEDTPLSLKDHVKAEIFCQTQIVLPHHQKKYCFGIVPYRDPSNGKTKRDRGRNGVVRIQERIPTTLVCPWGEIFSVNQNVLLT